MNGHNNVPAQPDTSAGGSGQSSGASGAQGGAHRLSCLPCRRRKSKCDRSLPCSSCVLRNTERFCYSSDVDDDADVPTHIKPSEKASFKASSASLSSSSSSSYATFAGGGNGSGPRRQPSLGERPVKQRKTTHRDSDAGDARETEVSGFSGDAQAIAGAIASVRATLRGLEEQLTGAPVSSDDARSIRAKVSWNDLVADLPSRTDCDTIIDCFQTQLFWHCGYLHRPWFEKRWTEFRSGRAMDRTVIGIICMSMALSILLTPSAHPAARLPNQKDRDYRRYVEIAFKVVDESRGPFDLVPETVEMIQFYAMAVNFFAYGGFPELSFQVVGQAIRLGKALQIFDEEGWEREKLSPLDIEIRRRLAWEITYSDRWISMHFMRDADLHNIIKTKPPIYYTDESYDLTTGQLVAEPHVNAIQADFCHGKMLLHIAVRDSYLFTVNFKSMTKPQRYAEARRIDNYISYVEKEGFTARLRFDNLPKLHTNDSPDRLISAAQSLIGVGAARRLRSGVMRQFLRDPDAPSDLRYGALPHARKIIEAIPVLVTLSTCPYIAFFSTWMSTMLFHAASTFSIVYLTGDDADSNGPEMPEENLNWFANNIFEVIEALSLVSEKDRIAKQCEGLLLALCTSRDKLRERFASRRLLVQRWNSGQGAGRGYNTGMLWSGTRIEPNSSLEQVWDSLPSTTTTNISSKPVEAFSSPSQNKPASSASSLSGQVLSGASKNAFPGVSWTPPPSGSNGNQARSTARHSPSVSFSDEGSGLFGTGTNTTSPVSVAHPNSTTPPTTTANPAPGGSATAHETPSSSEHMSTPSDGFTSVAGASWPLLDETQWADLLSQLDNDLDTFAGQGINPPVVSSTT